MGPADLVVDDPPSRDAVDIIGLLRRFTLSGVATVEFEEFGLHYFVNEYWTARQRQGHPLHEISYRACFKAQLPAFFIDRLTRAGDLVYDPFSGRGTTVLQAALMGRRAAGNDINPLSAMLAQPRLEPPSLEAIKARLDGLDLSCGEPTGSLDLSPFYHPETLRQVTALRRILLEREAAGKLDHVDRWIRMVAVNRLTGHSPGFFSVYTLPPNQAVSIVSQRRINAARGQTPPVRDVRQIILKKSRALLAQGGPAESHTPVLLTGSAHVTPSIADRSVALLVTSPPFLDIVDYEGDNWLRCWFCGIDPHSVRINRHRNVAEWQFFVRNCFGEFARIMQPGGIVAFEVGEVRGGTILLERPVADAMGGLPFDILGVMVNQQEFTKTANCWGVGNNKRGTNTNRIVLARRR